MNGQETVPVFYSATLLVFMVEYGMKSSENYQAIIAYPLISEDTAKAQKQILLIPGILSYMTSTS